MPLSKPFRILGGFFYGGSGIAGKMTADRTACLGARNFAAGGIAPRRK